MNSTKLQNSAGDLKDECLHTCDSSGGGSLADDYGRSICLKLLVVHNLPSRLIIINEFSKKDMVLGEPDGIQRLERKMIGRGQIGSSLGVSR
jgi:hypothetical protein